jgi:hypothetical protein
MNVLVSSIGRRAALPQNAPQTRSTRRYCSTFET